MGPMPEGVQPVPPLVAGGDSVSDLDMDEYIERVEIGKQHITAGDVGGFFHEFPTLMVDPRPTHARALGALTGKGERKHDGQSVIGYPRVLSFTGG